MNGGEPLLRPVRQFRDVAPAPQQRDAAGDQHGKWQGDEEGPECPYSPRVPHYDPVSGMRRFVLQWRQLPYEERAHEEDGREHEQQLRGSESTLGVHKALDVTTPALSVATVFQGIADAKRR